jgi:hypothetical protein
MKHKLPYIAVFVCCLCLSPRSVFSQEEEPEEIGEEIAVEEEEEGEAAAGESPEDIVEEEIEEGEPFDRNKAIEEATKLLYSPAVEGLLMECVEKQIVTRDAEFLMVVDIGPDGLVKAVKLPSYFSDSIKTCIAKTMAAFKFDESPDGLIVGARYAIRHEKAEPPAVEIEEKAAGKIAEGPLTDPGSNRLFYHQTAFTTKKKRVSMNFVDAGSLMMSIGVHDNVDITFNSMLPVMVWGFGIFPKIAFNAHEHVRIGLIPDFGLFILLPVPDYVMMMYGATPVFSFGNEDRCFNLSFHVQGIQWGGAGEEDDGMVVIAPEIGVSIRVAKRVKLNAELMSPLMVHMWGHNEWFDDFRKLDGVNTLNGKLWFVMVGLRVFGRKFYGDFGLAWAVFPGWWDFQKFMPIGWPVASFGAYI